MRLPAFAYERPGNLQEALELLHAHGANCRILAGGTDLLVRMKQRLTSPTHVISIRALPELDFIKQTEDLFRIGTAVRLSDILACKPIQDRLPGFHEAVRSVGAPSIQHFAGTIGGNLCQDNRCQFFNQSQFFRDARQACNKAGGKTCFAWEGGSDKCHSANQSDTAPILIAMNAQVIAQSRRGERIFPLAELYSGVGERPFTLSDDEMLVEIQIPAPESGTGTAFEKLAYRSAIDYAVVSAGALVRIDGDRIVQSSLIVGAVSRAPLAISAVEKILLNRAVGDEQAMDEAGMAARSAAEPFIANNMAQPIDYRTQMVSVMAKRALKKALKRAMAGTGTLEEQ